MMLQNLVAWGFVTMATGLGHKSKYMHALFESKLVQSVSKGSL